MTRREHVPGLEFDGTSLLAELDAVRGRAQLSWRQVGQEIGVSRSTFTRLRHGNAPDAVTLGRILAWTGERPSWMREPHL